VQQRKRYTEPSESEGEAEQLQQQQDMETEGGAAGGSSSSSSSSSALCSMCMRRLAMQAVDTACGTTLIVVPSTILVQVRTLWCAPLQLPVVVVGACRPCACECAHPDFTLLLLLTTHTHAQWVDELQQHIQPGAVTIKVYSGQVQAAVQPVTVSSSSSLSSSSSSAAAGKGRRGKSGKGAGAGSRSCSRSSTPAAAGPGSVREAAAAAASGARAAASDEVVTAAQLAAADVVVTTYDVMRREVALHPTLSDDSGAPNLRHRKR
jgi:hypothetical protein